LELILSYCPRRRRRRRHCCSVTRVPFLFTTWQQGQSAAGTTCRRRPTHYYATQKEKEDDQFIRETLGIKQKPHLVFSSAPDVDDKIQWYKERFNWTDKVLAKVLLSKANFFDYHIQDNVEPKVE
jgi:hypothetical protein